MGVQSQSALIAGLLLFGLAINVLWERRRVEHRGAFLGLLASLGVFNLAWFLASVSDGTLWLRLLLFAGILFPTACLNFFERFLGRQMSGIRTPSNALSIGLFLGTLTDLVNEPLFKAVVSVFAVGTYGYCIWCLHQRYRASESSVEAARLRYLVVGGALAVVFASIDLLSGLDVPTPGIGHLWTTVYMFFWMQVILRSKLLDLKEILGRGLALLSLAGVISLVYVAVLVWVDESLGLFFFNVLAASTLLVVIFEPLKRTVDLWAGRILFPQRYDLEAALRPLQNELANVMTLNDLVDTVCERLYQSRRVTRVSIYLVEGGGLTFQRRDWREGADSALPERVESTVARTFLDALTQAKALAIEEVQRDLVDLDDIASAATERARLEEVRRTMMDLEAQLSFAFIAEDRLLGFLNVSDERTQEAFSSYEIKLIAGLSARMTTAIANSELVRQLNERDRLLAIGEMATGMAHEIRNPLGAIKSAAQLLAPAEVDPESDALFGVIIDETNRLHEVLGQFLSFARPYQGELEEVDIGMILKRVATLVSVDAEGKPLAVKLEVERGLPKVLGAPDQLYQAILNLAINGSQAMDEEGTLTLGAQLVSEEYAPGGHGRRRKIEVLVRDDGPGIDEETQRNLFIPFFTTKRRGTGLGLPISLRILQHHGSDILIESPSKGGTEMRFRLFLAQDSALLDQQRRLRSREGD